MRLLNTQTFEFEEFPDTYVTPSYVILSHVWGKNEQTYQNVRAIATRDPVFGEPIPSSLSSKIVDCCQLALSSGYEYVWIDTCCIDKSSSAELSEAINSMFQWYAHSSICIAYLEDIPSIENHEEQVEHMRNSPWFTRGWTLQELIAPQEVTFVSRDWLPIGTKADLAAIIEEITGIDAAVLTGQRGLSDVSIARRMSWAARRKTTRREDWAYSLLGIFDVNMPTIYGEGPDKAFWRLQEEIMKRSPDQTMFAWGKLPDVKDLGMDPLPAEFEPRGPGLLAQLPSEFVQSAKMIAMPIDELPVAARCFVDIIRAQESDIRSVSVGFALCLGILLTRVFHSTTLILWALLISPVEARFEFARQRCP
jgi:hypothetical protein